MTPKSDAFAKLLAGQNLSEVDIAVAWVWFLGHENGHSADVSIEEVLACIRDHRLRGTVNKSRLSTRLQAHSDTVRGMTANSYRIKRAAENRYNEIFDNLIDPHTVPVADAFIHKDLYLGERKHLEAIRREANGSYLNGFYNSCAVMCRRISELLLIEAFEKTGNISAIQEPNGDLKGFGDIIGIAVSGNYLRLSRSTGRNLQNIKKIGDSAAHHRFYSCKKSDLDDVKLDLAQTLEELAALSGF
tara:strand:+ start:721 stop:1455 length:735 start_codon:yes stop_codon:yes gene_type:complete